MFSRALFARFIGIYDAIRLLAAVHAGRAA